MTDPKTAGDEGAILYHAVCPWSIRCKQCLLTIHDGETFICPFDKRRRVRASRRMTDQETQYTLVECLLAEDDPE